MYQKKLIQDAMTIHGYTCMKYDHGFNFAVGSEEHVYIVAPKLVFELSFDNL